MPLPGTVTTKVSFQRAREGFPLDDVVVHAELGDGRRASLQVQAKRTITFAPQDTVFKDVIAQVAKAIQEPGFWDAPNELAVATPRVTTKIAGAYQDVLKWARDMRSHEDFFARLARPGAANPDMRGFVDTFRANLKEAGAPDDDLTFWRILRRFHILIFDFESTGSLAETYAIAHARMLLPPQRAADAGALWATLVAIVLEKAATGGDLDHAALAQELAKRGFQAGDDRALAPVFTAIQSEARLALADIGTTVGTTRLARHEHLAALRDAVDNGRFVVIRGDAGVGKSGILRQVAERNAEDALILVLTPGHIAPNGFLAHCRRLGYQGTADDLLSRLAATGSATVFIDNLGRFTDDERITIKDVLRLSSRLSGITVVATARTSSGKPDDDWLPEEAVTALGGETTVLIRELSENDLEEVRAAEPRLRPILAESHPAKAVARNLFRLSRIARLPTGANVPTTELAMATHWWESADGPDAGRRERQRVLRKVADAVIKGQDVVDVADQDASAVDALIRTETLLDRGADRVALRHDVLREWAAANRLMDDPSLIPALPLARPAGPVLSRALELVARRVLERPAATPSWQDLLNAVSAQPHHPSWRRAVLLAFVNSEAATSLLSSHAAALFADDARLLTEILRAMRAANVLPAEVLLKGLLPEGQAIPQGLFLPIGNSWPRVVTWLIANFGSVPPPALKDVIDLFWYWSIGTFGQDQLLIPHILDRIYPLLQELRADEPTRLDALPRDQRRALSETLKTTFIAFCSVRPELAASYIALLAADSDRALDGILRVPGQLPQAAPQAFADLLRGALIRPATQRRRYGSEDIAEPFSYLDSFFYPPTEKAKAFEELLAHAPAIGLGLIRDILSHATNVLTRGTDPGEDGLTLVIEGQARIFPWTGTYRWGRQEGPNVVAAALDALRTWALARIQKGDPIAAVLGDVLGPPGTCAAFVLIAVDLLRSMDNPPLDAAIPFAGSPELLCLERENGTLDQLHGVGTLLPTRAPAFNPQNRLPFEYLVWRYAFTQDTALRETLRQHLEAAAQRLGPPDADATFGDPRVMVRLALNRINPANWSPHPQNPNQYVYTSPPDEARREEALQAAASPETRHFTIHNRLHLAVSQPERCTPTFAHDIAEWIANADATPNEPRSHPDDHDRLLAAYLVLRHGSDETVAKHGARAVEALSAAATRPRDPFSGGRMLEHNAAALAFAGLFHAYRRRPTPELVAKLLRLAATNPDASIGAQAVSDDIAALDPRLSKALVRAAFVACVKPRRRSSFDDAEDDDTRRAAHTQAVEDHVAAELAWLCENGAEPVWPPFPIERPRKRRGFRLPSADGTRIPEPPSPKPSDIFADEHFAAAWIGLLYPLCSGSTRAEVIAVEDAYQAYTSTRNGAGLERHAQVEAHFREGWNEAYYGLVAQLADGLTAEQLDAVCRGITDLPDSAFLEVAPTLLRPLQSLYFAGGDLEAQVLKIRSVFAARLVETREWRSHIQEATGGVEIHLGAAVPPLLFGSYVLGRIGCALRTEHLEKVLPLLPGASTLVRQGATLFTAGLAIALLEIKADARLLPLAVDVAEALLEAHPSDTALWNDHGFGQRWCRWLDALHGGDTASLSLAAPLHARIHVILGRLANIGVPEAAALERKLLS
jgi:hypothetical protein